MEMLGDLLIVGLSRGLMYAVFALGFVIIYKTSLVLNLAQGEIIYLLAMIGFELTSTLGIPLSLALPGLLLVSMLVGLLINWLVIRPLLEQPIVATVMVTIALGLVLRGIVTGNWQRTVYFFPVFFGIKPITLFNIMIPRSQLFVLALCGVGIFLLALFVTRTKQGLGMRASGEDMQIARSLGINAKVIVAITWAIACAIGGIGAFAVGTITGISGGIPLFGLSAIPVAILGGLESLKGAVIGGVIMGLLESIAMNYLDPLVPGGGGLAGVFPFIVMIFVLIFKPYGLFGLVRVERV